MPSQYSTEFTLNSYVSWGALLQQAEFDYLRIPEGKNPQIYFIGKRPRISCDVDQTSITPEGVVRGVAIIHKLEGEERVPFGFTTSPQVNDSELSLDIVYPYTLITVKKGDQRVGSLNVATALALQSDSIKEYLDMEILYVGQSFSGSDTYGIRQRLENHSTLQNIYSEAIRNFPNDEIWIGLFYFELTGHYVYRWLNTRYNCKFRRR